MAKGALRTSVHESILLIGVPTAYRRPRQQRFPVPLHVRTQPRPRPKRSPKGGKLAAPLTRSSEDAGGREKLIDIELADAAGCCPCGNAACSGEPNSATDPLFGRSASAVSTRQCLSVSHGLTAELPLTRRSAATESTRSSKAFHRPARMPPGTCTLAISVP